MNKRERDTLKSVVNSVMRDFAFLFSEPALPSLAILNESDFFQASIRAEGPVNIEFHLCLATSLSEEIAGNVLGISTKDANTQELSEDCTKELLNIISSHVVTRLNGEEAVFQLSIPHAQKITKSIEWNILMYRHRPVTLMVEGRPFMIWMD